MSDVCLLCDQGKSLLSLESGKGEGVENETPRQRSKLSLLDYHSVMGDATSPADPALRQLQVIHTS